MMESKKEQLTGVEALALEIDRKIIREMILKASGIPSHYFLSIESDKKNIEFENFYDEFEKNSSSLDNIN